jgi:molybdopterin-guanine dinucleotide biosynthesis protein MobB
MVQLITRLTKEGYRIATVKQTNKAISMDTYDKDTWKHHQAGAHLVVFSSQCETDFLLDAPLSSSEVLRRISQLGNFDFIFIEGANDSKIPKIRIGSCKKRPNTIATYHGNFQEIVRLITQYKTPQPSSPDLCIRVNGTDIPLTEFPKQIITNTIIGMLQSLKNVQEIQTVTIELKR